MAYTPLTPQQFQAARSAGFSADKIIEMEQRRKSEMQVSAPAQKSDVLFESKQGDSALMSAAKTVGNVLPDAWSFAKGVVSTMNPINIAKNLAAIPGEASALAKESGGAMKAAGAFAKEVPGATYEGFVPEAGRALLSGDLAGAKKGVVEHPVGTFAPLIFAGRAGAARMGKGAAFDQAMTTIAKPVTAPIKAVASKAGEAVGATTKFGVAQATGLKPETITAVTKNPEAFTKEAMGTVSRKGLGDEIKAKLDEKALALEETGAGYNPIRDLQAINKEVANTDVKVIRPGDGRSIVYKLVDAPVEKLSLPELRRKAQILEGDVSAKALLNKTNKEIMKRETAETVPHKVTVGPKFLEHVIKSNAGVEIKGGKVQANAGSTIREAKDVKALQWFYDTYKKAFADGAMTTTELLNMRRDAGKKLAHFDREIGKSGDLDRVGQAIYAKINEKYRPQVPGLEQLDLEFSTKIGEFNRLKDELFDKDNNLKKSATDKIANALGRGARKEEFMAKLEEISPGIGEKIRILKAVEDIQDASGFKVGTYIRPLTIGTAVFAGPVQAIITAILATPENAVPILRKYGVLKNAKVVREVIQGIQLGAGAVNALPGKLDQPMKAIPSAFAPRQVESVQ